MEHLLTFETRDQAITAKHALSGHVQATRSKVCEQCNEPAKSLLAWQDDTTTKALCNHCFNVRTQEALMSQSIVENCL